MTDTQKLNVLETVAKWIDPKGRVVHFEDDEYGYNHDDGTMYICPDARLAIRLDQARRWIEQWCDDNKGIIEIEYECGLWTINVYSDRPPVRASGPSLAHALAAAIDALTAMTDNEMHRLANYNAERSRGILHTPEYDAEMAILQKQFYAEQEHKDEMVEGHVEHRNGQHYFVPGPRARNWIQNLFQRIRS